MNIKTEIANLEFEGFDISSAFEVFGLNNASIFDLPVINWEEIENKMSKWEVYFSEDIIDYVDELIHIMKTAYYYKLIEAINKVHEESGFFLDAKSRAIVPTSFNTALLNLDAMGIKRIQNLYNSKGYQALNSSGSSLPDIVTFELLASCKTHLLERVGYQLYRDNQNTSDCINVTSLIKRRLQPYLCNCPWSSSDTDTSWKSWRD